MLWGQPVVDGQDRAAGRPRDDAAERVVGLQIPDDASAHVEIDEQRDIRVLSLGAVGARRHGAVRQIAGQRFEQDTGLWRASHHRQPTRRRRARLGRRQVDQGRLRLRLVG
jgi:hypothetical protein